MEMGFATALRDVLEAAEVGESCRCFSLELEAAFASTARYRQCQLMLHIDRAVPQAAMESVLYLVRVTY